MDILQSAKDYFNMEYNDAERFVSRPSTEDFWGRQCIDKACARCLGVAFFVQELGVSYEEINLAYEEVQKKLYALIEKAN